MNNKFLERAESTLPPSRSAMFSIAMAEGLGKQNTQWQRYSSVNCMDLAESMSTKIKTDNSPQIINQIQLVGQRCRFCQAQLKHTFVDLGMSPLCESLITEE